MLTIIFLIAFMSTVIEFAMMWYIPPLRRFMDAHTWPRIPLSLLISFILGAGGGQIVVIGAMIVSTGFSVVFYSLHVLDLIEACVMGMRRAKRAVVQACASVASAWRRTQDGYRKVRHPISSRRTP